MSEHDDKQREQAERDRQERERKEAEAREKAKAQSTTDAADGGDGGDGAPTDGVGEEFGETTKDDATDAGVPMLPGSAGEPQGPEDAFGEGLKRGDYADRVGTNQHAQSVPTEDGGEPVYADDGDGNQVQVDVKPRSTLVSQNDRVDEIGDEAGEKGGVTTTPA